jgi:RimJ/RimL family protein N-acetyltransferase
MDGSYRPARPAALAGVGRGCAAGGHTGSGLATEAAAAVLDWAERHGVDVYASVRPPNPASVRVLEKIGMRLVDSYSDEDGQRDIYRR